VRNAVDRLSLGFFFDPVESDNKVKFIDRGQSSSDTIDQDDLGAAVGDLPDQPRRILETSQQDIELPKLLDLEYIDLDRDYQAGNQMAKRHDSAVTTSKELQQIKLPVVFTAAEAAAIVQSWMRVAWTERQRKQTTLPLRFLESDPSDVVTITRTGQDNAVVRLNKTSLGSGLLLEHESVVDDSDLYTAVVNTSGGTGFTEDSIAFPGLTRLFLFDIPYLRDQDAGDLTVTGPYMSTTGFLPAWRGAIVHKSNDGSSWDHWDTFDTETTWGVTLDAGAANANPFQWDRSTVITVSVANGTFSSATESQLVENNANAALWGSPSAGWEIVKFADVTDNGDGTVDLSTFIRGRRGTENECKDGHASGEFFILLSVGVTRRKLFAASEIGSTRYFRATSVGDTLDHSTVTALSLVGNDLKPYAPVHIEGLRDGSDNLDITWIRQDRIGGDNNWRDAITDIPMSETTESYKAYLLNKSTGAEEAEQSETTEAATFTAAQVSTAGYNTTEPVNVRVYQVSSVVGNGFPGNATVAPDDTII
jgi:hypothetical protein